MPYKVEVVRRLGPRRNAECFEFEPLDGMNGFNNRLLLEPIGRIPSSGHEVVYHQCQEAPAMPAGLNEWKPRKTRGGSCHGM